MPLPIKKAILPFPLPLNIGTDIVHLPRIRSIIRDEKRLPSFMRRILTQNEAKQFHERFLANISSSDQSQSSDDALDQRARWLAGRFAAKEALRKAVGPSLVTWKRCMVQVLDGGRPQMLFWSHATNPGQIARLSISHDGDYVCATVLAPEPIVPNENAQETTTEALEDVAGQTQIASEESSIDPSETFGQKNSAQI